jgi:hypothetical protein
MVGVDYRDYVLDVLGVTRDVRIQGYKRVKWVDIINSWCGL